MVASIRLSVWHQGVVALAEADFAAARRDVDTKKKLEELKNVFFTTD